MLHILWLILKFILILLGIVLGLILLAVLLLLFCPVCYQASGSRKEEKIQAYARVSWLFRGIMVTLQYQEGRKSLNIKILGISLAKLRGLLSGRKKRSAGTKPGMQQNMEKKENSQSASEQAYKLPDQENKKLEQRKETSQEEKLETENSPEEHVQENLFSQESPKRPSEEETPAEKEESQEEASETFPAKKSPLEFFYGFFRKIRSFFQKLAALYQRVIAVPGNIQEKVQRISEKLRKLYEKFLSWKKFFDDVHTREALSLVWGQAKILLRHVFPRKLQGHVLLGLEDPSQTGMILAVLGMTMPLHKNRIAVEPVYDRVVLEGEAELAGRIYGFVFVKTALRVWFDQNVKDVRKRLKQKEVI